MHSNPESLSIQTAASSGNSYDNDPALMRMDDDGAGQASTSRNTVHSGYRDYDAAIAAMADDGFGCAPRGR